MRRHAFTLLELLVAIATGVVLVSILVPYVMRVREDARRTACASHLNQIRIALVAYARENGNDFPRVRWDRDAGGYAAYSGADAGNPFAPDGAVAANDVTAAVWLLVRQGFITDTGVFICPSVSAARDPLLGPAGTRVDPRERSNFRRAVYLTYSYASPYSSADGYRLNDTQPADFAVMADLSPGIAGPGDGVTEVRATDEPLVVMRGNSNNHGKAGQNVLYAFGRAEFRTTPFAGHKGDNIYTALVRQPEWARGVPVDQPGVFGRDVQPAWAADSYLVPSDDDQ